MWTPSANFMIAIELYNFIDLVIFNKQRRIYMDINVRSKNTLGKESSSLNEGPKK